MARAEIPLTIIDPATGNAIVGASVAVKLRATGVSAVVYAAETGATTVANPRTSDAYGRVSGWVDRGAYQFDISGTGLTSYTEFWDAATSGDGGLDTAWLADDAVTSAKIAALPHAVVESAADTVVANGSFVSVVFDTARYDLGTATPQWSAGTNPNRLTCREAGLYYIQFTTGWPPNATGIRMAQLFVNGVERQRPCVAGFSLSSAGPTLSQGFLFRLAVGDYVSVNVYQASGVSLTILGAYQESRPRLSMAYLSA